MRFDTTKAARKITLREPSVLTVTDEKEEVLKKFIEEVPGKQTQTAYALLGEKVLKRIID